MPRNSSGNYTLPSAINPVVANTTITASWANLTLTDVAQAVTDSLDRQGRGSMLAPLKLANGTESAPALTFASESNSGLYRASAGDFRLSVAGSDVLQMEVGKVTAPDDMEILGSLAVTGAIVGDVTGDVLGNVVGDLTGDVTGNLTGDVTGNVSGTAGGLSVILPVADGGTGMGVALWGHIYGLRMSTPGSSTSMTIGAGQTTDEAAAAAYINLSAPITKNTTAWAVGSAAGGLDSGVAAINTWYHWYVIRRPDTDVVDACFSLSVAGPTVGGNIPAAYTQFRRVGSMLLNSSGQWERFVQHKNFFQWVTPTNESFGVSVLTPTLRTITRVPPGISVMVRGMVLLANTGGAMDSASHWDPALGAAKPGEVGTLQVFVNSVVSQAARAIIDTRTDTSARIYNTCSGSALTTYTYQVLGWFDDRGQG